MERLRELLHPVMAASLLLLAIAFRPSPQSSPTEEVVSSSIGTDFSDYIWPTDAAPVITSTFAEYRRTHFHGGIDIGTGNDTGFRVFAVRDGYVARIRVNADGYGKMLYVRHPDGFYSTYAHLRNFKAEIDDRVQKEQYSAESYIVDITCGPDEFPVKKGEVIAYTGQTGTGSPHLHFEIRDSSYDFVNPLLCGSFPNPDRISPSPGRIAVRPLGAGSRVNGIWKVQLFNLHQRKKGVYELAEEIHLRGEAGFEIDIRDRTEGTHYRRGLYLHELFVDDSLFYRVRLDRAPSARAHESGLFYDWDLIDAGRGRFQKLFMHSPNHLGFSVPPGDSGGIISLSRFPPGEHSFRIVSADGEGNTAEVSGSFILHPPVRVDLTATNGLLRISVEPPDRILKVLLSARSKGSRQWSTRNYTPVAGVVETGISGSDVLRVIAKDEWEGESPPSFFFPEGRRSGTGLLSVTHDLEDGFLRFHVTSDDEISSPPVLRVYGENGELTVPLQAIDLNHWIGTVVPGNRTGKLRRAVAQSRVDGDSSSAFEEFDICPILQGTSGTYFADDGNLVLSFTPRSVLKSTFVEVRKGDFEGSRTYRLEPSPTVLDEGMTAAMKSRTPGQAGLFLHSRRGWTLLAASSNPAGGMISGRVTQTLGELAIVPDTIAPTVSNLRVGSTKRVYPVISFRFWDDFSGVEYRGLKMYIDGRVAIPEIDDEHRVATYTATEPLDAGNHVLTIRIADKLGNSREVTKEFRIRQ